MEPLPSSTPPYQPQGSDPSTTRTSRPPSLEHSYRILSKGERFGKALGCFFATLLSLGLGLFFPILRKGWKEVWEGKKIEDKTFSSHGSRDNRIRHAASPILLPAAEKENPPVQAQKSYRPPTDPKTLYMFRKEIYQETLRACDRGYCINKKRVTIESDAMKRETICYRELSPLSPAAKRYQTQFSVRTEDTFQVLVGLRKQGKNPVGINLANRFYPGGGVEDGCPAQEESLCRRSNHIFGLKTQRYPFPENGGIYCPHVQVFRNSDFTFMEDPVDVALVAIAGYDLRDNSGDRQALNLPLTGPLTDLNACELFTSGTKNKIRNMLREMAEKGHANLVLGALGCGAFQNPPELVARLFKEVFQEKEFEGRFESVDFAILRASYDRDDRNVTAFQNICGELSPAAF